MVRALFKPGFGGNRNWEFFKERDKRKVFDDELSKR
jgi:hypothetical protein